MPLASSGRTFLAVLACGASLCVAVLAGCHAGCGDESARETSNGTSVDARDSHDEGEDGDDDADDSGEEGDDVDDTGDDEDDLSVHTAWQQFDNGCAPDRSVVSPEQLEPPSVPSDAPETPTLDWERGSFCPETGENPLLGHRYALGHFDVGGGDRHVLLAVQHGGSAGVLGPTPEYLAALDPVTGDTLGCHPLPRQAHSVEDPLRIISGQAAYLPYVNRPPESGDGSDVVGLVAIHPEGRQLFDWNVELSG